MSTTVLYVHSPLLGPSTWKPMAAVTEGSGLSALVPDLTPVAASKKPTWEAMVELVTIESQGISGQLIVVGHSGAGVLLPAIAQRLEDHNPTLVFVDAVLPPKTGHHTTAPDRALLLDEQTADDGILRSWSSWWPAGMLEQLLPDPGDRQQLESDMPRLRRSFYDGAVPVPDGWSSRSSGFVKLSDAYDAEYVEATRRGWPTAAMGDNHLSVISEPEAVFAAMLDVVARATNTNPGPGSRPHQR